MADIIQLRRDLKINWSNVNPILFLGEIGIEIDTHRFKIGNGIDVWNSLEYSKTYSNDVICQESFVGFLASCDTLSQILEKIDLNVFSTNSISLPEFHIPISNGTTLISSSDLMWNGSNLNINGDITFSGNIFGNGSELENLNASNISQGILDVSRMGTGTPNSNSFLRGDGTWQIINGGTSGDYLALSGGKIVGNLSVEGNFDTNSSFLTLGNLSDNKDIGIKFRYFNSSEKIGFFGRDSNTGYFVYIPDSIDSNGEISGLIGDIQATNFRGSLVGNSDTTSKFISSRTISMSGDVSWTSGNFDGSSNVTGISTLSNTGVTPGTYNNSNTEVSPFTVDNKGRITSVGSPVKIKPELPNPLKISSDSDLGTILEISTTNLRTSSIIDVRVDGVSKFIISETGNIILSGDVLVNGEFQLGGNATVFDDLTFPATSINPTGDPTGATIDNNNGWYQFDATVQQVVAIQAQLPHKWKEGSTLYPHVHWAKSDYTAGKVVWQLEYKWFPIAGIMDSNWTTLLVSTPIDGTPDTNTARKHLISAFPGIDASGKKISDILVMKLSRLAPDVSDTYASTALMFQFDVHYEINSFGSRSLDF